MKATAEEIALSLEGNWRAELLFVLGQEVELYRVYQKKIADCDRQLRRKLEAFRSQVNVKSQPLGPRVKNRKASKNAPQFDLRTELHRITGIDWTKVEAWTCSPRKR